MRITKRQLRRIIREALNRRALNESHPFDAMIDEYAELKGDGRHASDYIHSRLSADVTKAGTKRLGRPWTKDEVKQRTDIMSKIIGDLRTNDDPNQYKEILELLPDGFRDDHVADLEKVLKSTAKPAPAKQNKKETHAYDVSIGDAVDAGMYSNSDAVDEVRNHLSSAGAMDLVDEIDMMVRRGDDDIYDVLSMIPAEVKDKLPIG